jgi:hypothetical protein
LDPIVLVRIKGVAGTACRDSFFLGRNYLVAGEATYVRTKLDNPAPVGIGIFPLIWMRKHGV